MTKLNLEQEKHAADIISGSMYSIGFLRNITVAFSKEPSMPVRKFNEVNKAKAKAKNTDIVPYNFGAIFGFLYCGILLAKENWYNLLPDDELPMSDPEWCLSDVTPTSKQANPTVKYVIRRIRNALGHGNFIINVPKDLKEGADEHEFEKKITIEFHDKDQSDSSNIFDIELSLYRLIKIVKKFQAITYKHVTSKI